MYVHWLAKVGIRSLINDRTKALTIKMPLMIKRVIL